MSERSDTMEKGWSPQGGSGKGRLPNGIFRLIGDADAPREVATKNYLPPGLEEGLDGGVCDLTKGKRKAT